MVQEGLVRDWVKGRGTIRRQTSDREACQVGETYCLLCYGFHEKKKNFPEHDSARSEFSVPLIRVSVRYFFY